MINTKQLQDTIISDAINLGVYDQQSITILAIGRIAQATLENEVERLVANGADADGVEAHRSERGAQLDRWIAIETERARMRTVAREEAS